MPAKKIGTCTWYPYLTKAEEQAFWHQQRNSPGVAIPASAVKAVKEGKTVVIEERKPRKRVPANPG